MRAAVVAFVLYSFFAAHAQSIDGDGCESAAKDLENAASTVADAADSLPNEQVRNLKNAESRLAQVARDALSKAQYMAGKCGASQHITEQLALQNIKRYLEIRFGQTDESRAKIRSINAELEFIALGHSMAQPADFKQSFALAGLLFEHAPAPPAAPK